MWVLWKSVFSPEKCLFFKLFGRENRCKTAVFYFWKEKTSFFTSGIFVECFGKLFSVAGENGCKIVRKRQFLRKIGVIFTFCGFLMFSETKSKRFFLPRRDGENRLAGAENFFAAAFPVLSFWENTEFREMFSKALGKRFDNVDNRNFVRILRGKPAVPRNVSAKNAENIDFFSRKSEICPQIHMGFQQAVENLFENFPPFEQEKYGYPKHLGNSCGKGVSGVGKPDTGAKKQPVRRQTHIFRKFSTEIRSNPQSEKCRTSLPERFWRARSSVPVSPA